MPLVVPTGLPAVDLLRKECIFVMENECAIHQDIRKLRLAVLNLMPLKILTETDLIRVLSNNALQVEVDLMKLRSHTSKTTSPEHMEEFYSYFDELKHKRYDGLIITGAPIEKMPFEDVLYWEEFKQILDWSRTNVTSTLFICWAAMAALYYFHAVPKHMLPHKMFGVFEHRVLQPRHPIFRGFDDVFLVPHSRHTEIRRSDLEKVRGVEILAESADAGVYMAMARGGRDLFVVGHSEYSPMTLDGEYRRDVAKGEPINIPLNYYQDNDPSKEVVVRWRGHAHLFFNNWLNYFVYQMTPFDVEQISNVPSDADKQ